MTKATRKKWKRANRMMALWYDDVRSAGRYPESVLDWAIDYTLGRYTVAASLALDGLSVKELP